jgi:hypothetical protein
MRKFNMRELMIFVLALMLATVLIGAVISLVITLRHYPMLRDQNAAVVRMGRADLRCASVVDCYSHSLGSGRELQSAIPTRRIPAPTAHSVGTPGCYSFIVRYLHPLLLAGLPAHSENLHNERHRPGIAHRRNQLAMSLGRPGESKVVFDQSVGPDRHLA